MGQEWNGKERIGQEGIGTDWKGEDARATHRGCLTTNQQMREKCSGTNSTFQLKNFNP